MNLATPPQGIRVHDPAAPRSGVSAGFPDFRANVTYLSGYEDFCRHAEVGAPVDLIIRIGSRSEGAVAVPHHDYIVRSRLASERFGKAAAGGDLEGLTGRSGPSRFRRRTWELFEERFVDRQRPSLQRTLPILDLKLRLPSCRSDHCHCRRVHGRSPEGVRAAVIAWPGTLAG